MHHVFIPPHLFDANPIVLTGDDHHHLARVLRLRSGEALIALDGTGRAYHTKVASIGPKEIALRVLGPADVAPEPPVAIRVCQAIGRGDRFDEVLQHDTEVGVSSFVPLLTERGVVRFDARDADAKLARWQRIVRGAAEQSHRARVPSVTAPVTVTQATGDIPDGALLLLLDQGGPDLVEVLPAGVVPSSILLFVGPEGGFTFAEAQLLCGAGAERVSLGRHVLRTETAALVAIARIMHHVAVVSRESQGAIHE
jgi:16S rRNA (uracil1498-N3)-methyltransferase